MFTSSATLLAQAYSHLLVHIIRALTQETAVGESKHLQGIRASLQEGAECLTLPHLPALPMGLAHGSRWGRHQAIRLRAREAILCTHSWGRVSHAFASTTQNIWARQQKLCQNKFPTHRIICCYYFKCKSILVFRHKESRGRGKEEKYRKIIQTPRWEPSIASSNLAWGGTAG